MAFVCHGQVNASTLLRRPADLTNEQLANGRKLVWATQTRRETYTVVGDMQRDSMFLRLAFNPLPLDTSTPKKLEAFYLPHASVSVHDAARSKLTSSNSHGIHKHLDEANERSRLLYEDATGGQAAALHIDDSVETARQNWSWCKLEDRLREKSDEEERIIMDIQRRLADAKALLAQALTDNDAQAQQTANNDIRNAESELQAAFEKRRRDANQSLEEIFHNLADTANGCTGARRISERFALFQNSAGVAPDDPKFRNGCNAWGLIDPNQSFFQNLIARRMIQVDKASKPQRFRVFASYS